MTALKLLGISNNFLTGETFVCCGIFIRVYRDVCMYVYVWSSHIAEYGSTG